MTILCAVTCLLQFVGLVALTGVLVCLVAVLRLVELAITLINPFTIFMLHQSGKIIIELQQCWTNLPNTANSSSIPVSLKYVLKAIILNNFFLYMYKVLEVILTDLSAKFPGLKYVVRPEYAPYLNTAGTVLLGWLIVSWISYFIWAFLAPLMITVIAIILICPTTAKWCVKQTIPGMETVFNEFLEMFQTILSQICD